MHGEGANLVLRPLTWVYRPLLRWALRHRVLTLSAVVLVFAGAVTLIPRIGREFMPPLNEGDLMFMPITDPAIALPQAIEITKKQNAAMQQFPEVAAVVTMPGVANIWTQPIINRINMLTTGIRSEVGVKLFGHDLAQLEERARAVAAVRQRIPGAVDVYPEQVTVAPYLDIRVKREAAARYGITVGAIQDVIETAVGETNLALTIEGRQRFPVRVRYAPQYRATPEALASLPVPAPSGTQVPLGQVAVSTVVASLLPIMWSHSTGAEVMKPLATPVLGGMVSSLAHVLLVTPVIFYWLREREIRRETEREALGTDLALQGRSIHGSTAGHSVPTIERSNN